MRNDQRLACVLAAMVSASMMWSASQAQPAGGSTPQILGAIDENARITLTGNTRPEATAANDRGAVSDGLVLDHMQMLLRRPPAQEQAFETAISQLYDRNSPNFHHWLTADQIGQQFGPAAQ